MLRSSSLGYPCIPLRLVGGVAQNNAVKTRIALPTVALLASSLAVAPPLFAADGIGIYGTWAFTSTTAGTLNMGGVLPNATVTITGGSGSVASGSTIFLNQNTPVGTEYGSSLNKTYASIGLGSSFTVPGTPAVTTVRFASATPASGWSFALGDIDAEDITITAEGASGALNVTGWFQSAFNYCATPKPSGCGAGTPTDAPRWVAPTLEGNKVDTAGAAAWFTPNVAVTELTFTQTRNVAGGPSFQLWIMSDTAIEPEPSPSPSDWASPSPTPSSSESPSPSPSPSESEAESPSPSPTPSPSAGESTTDEASPPSDPGNSDPGSPTTVVKPGEPTVIDVVSIAGAPSGSTVASVEPPANGTARIDGASVVYTPSAGYYGSDVITASVVDRAGVVTTVTVPVQVGLVQRPVRPPKLAKQITRGGTTVVLGAPVRTNARQLAQATVTCSAKARMVYRGGGEPLCVVTRAKGQIAVRVTGAGPVTVRVELAAPAKGQYGPYAFTKRYSVQ